jgi:CRISPR-associated protein Cas1
MAFLYITEQGAVLKKTGERLVVEKDDETLLDIPASKVEGVLIFGNVQFTTQAVQLLFKQGIEMGLFSYHGKLLGQLTSPMTKNITLRQCQYARHSDPVYTLVLAKTIVSAKIANGLELAREFNHNHPEAGLAPEIARLAELHEQAASKEDLQSLLGLEGASAHAYFSLFGRMLRRSFEFTGRRRRPAPDPVNALLSLGYTLIYNEIESLLDGMGFDPYLGFYHQPRYGHATLASDLMEEFRAPLVDRLTLYLINNGIFKEDDFFLHTASGSKYLTDEARKRYFHEYEHFVTRPMSVADEENMTHYRALFRRQAERFKQAISETTAYEPHTFSW